MTTKTKTSQESTVNLELVPEWYYTKASIADGFSALYMAETFGTELSGSDIDNLRVCLNELNRLLEKEDNRK